MLPGLFSDLGGVNYDTIRTVLDLFVEEPLRKTYFDLALAVIVVIREIREKEHGQQPKT